MGSEMCIRDRFQLLRGLPVEVQRTFGGDPETTRTDRTWVVQGVVATGLDANAMAERARDLLLPLR